MPCPDGTFVLRKRMLFPVIIAGKLHLLIYMVMRVTFLIPSAIGTNAHAGLGCGLEVVFAATATGDAIRPETPEKPARDNRGAARPTPDDRTNRSSARQASGDRMPHRNERTGYRMP